MAQRFYTFVHSFNSERKQQLTPNQSINPVVKHETARITKDSRRLK